MCLRSFLIWLGSNIFDILESVSIIIAAIVAIKGIDSWRRELRGSKEVELSEQVLALFYECRDNIRFIRNPFSHSDEGSTRKGEKEKLKYSVMH
jgi:hypothetical protein